MKHALSLSLCLAAAFCSPAAQAQAPRTLEFVVQAAASDPAARALSDFARAVETQTRGAVRVRLRTVTTSVVPGTLRNGAQSGALMLREDLEGLCPTVAAFRAPMLFPDLPSMDRIFETMRPVFESECVREVTVLGWTLPGPRHVFLQAPAEPNGEGLLSGVGLTETSPLQRSFFAAQPEVDPATFRAGTNRVVPGVVVAPGERGLFAGYNHVVMTPAGMELGALVVNTVAFSALTPEQQQVVREAATSTTRALTRTLRAVPLGNVTRIPESPAWTAWAEASRTRARANGGLGPLMSRMQLMLGPVTPPQTGREVVPSPAPSAPRPSAPTTEPAPTTQAEPAVEPTPAQTPPAAQPVVRPGIDFPTGELPAALMEAGYPRALAALRPRILRCYEPALRAPTPISGQVTFELRISTHGGVVGIRRLNAPALTTITEPVLTRCVESVLRGLRLPQVQSDTVTVQQTVVLRAP
jgi:hypothetical protein